MLVTELKEDKTQSQEIEFFNSFDHVRLTTISSNTVNSTGDAIHVAVVDEDRASQVHQVL